MTAPIELDRSTGLIYRILGNDDPREWERLKPIFKANDWFLPDPMLSNAAVCENEDGEIVGAQLLQLVLHSEPTYVDSRYRGKVNYLRMWKLLEKLPKSNSAHLVVPGYVLVCPTEEIARMAELGGFEPIEGKMFRKLWTE